MTLPRTTLAPGYEISRVIRGGWQLAGGHGPIEQAEALDDLIATADAGITTFDCADIYTGVEEIIGGFRAEYAKRHGADALSRIRVHTNCVPDLDKLAHLTRPMLRETITRSAARLGVERLDLVQFHWWDYAMGDWLQAAHWLKEFQDEGLINLLSATNFDTDHVAAMFDSGIRLATLQTQYSLLDRRPEKRMAALAEKQGMQFLCYGTVAGGVPVGQMAGSTSSAGPDGEPVADQVSADHSRSWRLGPVSDAAPDPARYRGQAGLRHRNRGISHSVDPPPGRRRHRRSAQP